MLEFAYLAENIRSPAPPSLPAGTAFRFRPYIPIRVLSPDGAIFRIAKALLDTGSQDTIFSYKMASTFGISLLPPTGHVMRWRGAAYPLRFGQVEFQIESHGTICQWSSIVAFSAANLAYPLLGHSGFLEFFDATFRGSTEMVELAPNLSFRGSIAQLP